jgi:hypothetical protein
MTTINDMMALARRQPLASLAGALAILDRAGLTPEERQARAVIIDVICEKSPAAQAAFVAWSEDDDAPADGGVPAILAAVTGGAR